MSVKAARAAFDGLFDLGGFAAPAQKLDFGNSGTGCRLMLGAVAGCRLQGADRIVCVDLSRERLGG